jgi:hypothetical protein
VTEDLPHDHRRVNGNAVHVHPVRAGIEVGCSLVKVRDHALEHRLGLGLDWRRHQHGGAVIELLLLLAFLLHFFLLLLLLLLLLLRRRRRPDLLCEKEARQEEPELV